MRTLLMFLVVVVLLALAGAYFYGYPFALPGRPVPAAGAAGTTGTTPNGGIDTTKAPERGAEVSQKIAEAGHKTEEYLSESVLTAKIKSKMALDDHVKAMDIHVTTDRGGVVTLSGSAHSEDERRRAVSLARDTAGVTKVIDQIVIAR